MTSEPQRLQSNGKRPTDRAGHKKGTRLELRPSQSGDGLGLAVLGHLQPLCQSGQTDAETCCMYALPAARCPPLASPALQLSNVNYAGDALLCLERTTRCSAAVFAVTIVTNFPLCCCVVVASSSQTARKSIISPHAQLMFFFPTVQDSASWK